MQHAGLARSRTPDQRHLLSPPHFYGHALHHWLVLQITEHDAVDIYWRLSSGRRGSFFSDMFSRQGQDLEDSLRA